MKKIFTLIFLSLFLLNKAQNVNREYVDGQIFLKFKTGTIKSLNKENPNNIPLDKITILKDFISKYGITKAYKPFYQADDDVDLMHILQLEFTNKTQIDSLIEDLKKNHSVDYAEKVMLLKTHVTPNDPTVGAHLTQINAQSAWTIFNSTSNGNSNITVAIVDNAIDRSHPDLVSNIYTNPGEIAANLIDDDNNGYVDDVNGYDVADFDNNTIPTNNAMDHGTHTSGIAGARTDNSLGVASIGWNVKIIPVKCAKDGDPTTSVNYGYNGIIYAAKAKARVISCSWGGTGAPSAAAQSVIDYAWNKGCVIFCSAGNDNDAVLHYPGAYNNVVAVASVANNDVKSSFSCYGTWVDISAPGENILSTTPANTYQSFSGTSMACPLTAGLAALMLSKCSYMTQNDVINCILTTAASSIYTIAANSAYTPNQLGTGRINAFAAMNCAAGFLTHPPVANFFSVIRNTCPNTPIVFTDSSLYAATSWTWNFQGGTPAVSTVSNPSVTWTTPGVYNVTLTAGNSNGTNTKVKNGYITIAGPIALPLVEGFQGAPFLPVNWSSYNIDNDSVYWEKKFGVGGFTVNAAAACAMFDDYDEDATGLRDEMRTPRYNFSNVANAKIRFDVAYKQFDNTANITPQNPYSDTLELKLTTNCGTSWTSIYSKGGATLSTSPGTLQANVFVPLASEWRTDSINISGLAALQPNVMITFVNRGHYGQALYVDNINIFLPAPSMAVASPTSGCTGISVTFTNNSTGAAGYTWTANPPATATLSAPNGTNTNVTFGASGLYSITCVANNGTVTSTITKTISVAIQPTVALATTTTNLCSGTNVTLTASGASSYSWSTTQTTNSIVVTPTITTTYTVNGSNANCSNVQSQLITVTLTPNVVVNNQTICAAGTATIIASGATTYSWSNGFNGDPLIVSPASNTVYTVVGKNGVCSNTQTVSVTIGSSITIIPSATTPTICAGGTVGLSATGATTFTWQPVNLTGSAITVTPASSTIYTVSGTNGGCNGNATISVNIISAPALLLNPVSSSVCAGGSSTINASGYTTYTWNPGNLSGNSNILTPAATQIYSVTGKIGNCIGNSTAVVSVINYPTVTVTGNTVICVGKSTNLTASGAGTYSWSTSALTSTVNVSPITLTSYTVTGSNSNCGTPVVVSVSVNPNPTLAISSSSNPICIGDAVNITGNGATSYTWDSGSTFNPIFSSPTITTTYTLTGAVNGCTSTAMFTETVNSCGSTGLKTQALVNNELMIFPNPSSDQLTISYFGKNFDYMIYDNVGRLIASDKGVANQVKIKVSEYARGVYYIEVTADKEKTRRKLIID